MNYLLIFISICLIPIINSMQTTNCCQKDTCKKFPEYFELNLIWPLSYYIDKYDNEFRVKLQKMFPSNQDALSRFQIGFFAVNTPNELFFSFYDCNGVDNNVSIDQDPELGSLMNYFWPNIVSEFTNNSAFWNYQVKISTDNDSNYFLNKINLLFKNKSGINMGFTQ